MKLVITFEQHQRKNSAMVAVGIDPRAMSIKPGNRVHTDRKKAASRGNFKHKSRMFD